jgi:hypothetical protein
MDMTKSVLTLGVVAILCAPLAAKADVITGVLNTSGTVDISTGSISFLGNELVITSPASAQQGGFSTLAGSTGTIQNLASTAGAENVPDFITFALDPNISITLTSLFAGIDGSAGCSASPPAAGQVCTPTGSSLDLQNTGSTSSTLSFNVAGVEHDSVTGDSVAINGEFSIALASENYQQVLSTIAGGGTASSTFAGQFATSGPIIQGSPVPEPSTLFLLMIGIAGIAVVRSKSSRSATV